MLADVPVRVIGMPHMWDGNFVLFEEDEDDSEDSSSHQLGWGDRLTRAIWDARGTNEEDLRRIAGELKHEDLMVSSGELSRTSTQ